ncbi:nucleoside triphosphate pyrophosphohydrolase [Candidatus Uhrbacteria bacterium]|nr:nucleoside triphosphate pyrophosphohydrolase [Candidatus Uhrbacteria bacterium]
MKYNKLVRDKIPQIIADDGSIAVTHIADGVEYWEMLKAKLLEEAAEVVEDTNVKEELADLLEVIHSILEYKKISFDELEVVRLEKRAKRGGFEDRIILEETR